VKVLDSSLSDECLRIACELLQNGASNLHVASDSMSDRGIGIGRECLLYSLWQLAFPGDGATNVGGGISVEQLKDGDWDCLVVRNPLAHFWMVCDKLSPDGVRGFLMSSALILVGKFTGPKSDECLSGINHEICEQHLTTGSTNGSCAPPCTIGFCKTLQHNEVMLPDLRISIKDHRRAKNLKILLYRVRFGRPKLSVRMNGRQWPRDANPVSNLIRSLFASLRLSVRFWGFSPFRVFRVFRGLEVSSEPEAEDGARGGN
jgi:hypothetical protein